MLGPPKHDQTYLQVTAKVFQRIIRGWLPTSCRGSRLISLSPLEQEATPLTSSYPSGQPPPAGTGRGPLTAEDPEHRPCCKGP